jgi:hypothetical protein
LGGGGVEVFKIVALDCATGIFATFFFTLKCVTSHIFGSLSCCASLRG